MGVFLRDRREFRVTSTHFRCGVVRSHKTWNLRSRLRLDPYEPNIILSFSYTASGGYSVICRHSSIKFIFLFSFCPMFLIIIGLDLRKKILREDTIMGFERDGLSGEGGLRSFHL